MTMEFIVENYHPLAALFVKITKNILHQYMDSLKIKSEDMGGKSEPNRCNMLQACRSLITTIRVTTKVALIIGLYPNLKIKFQRNINPHFHPIPRIIMTSLEC